MSTRVGRSVDSRKAGLIIASAFAAISGGVVLYFVASGRQSTESTVTATPPDIGQPPSPTSMTGGASRSGAVGAFNSSGRALLQFVDKKDPTRIASEMEWESLNPDDAQRGRSHITEPRFWIYPEDGSTIHVQAMRATVFMPDQQSEPESGRLFGGTVIRIFSPGPDGKRRAIDLEKDVPLALISTESIEFDTALGEIAAPTTCDISTTDVEARFASLRIHVSELQRRLQFLEAGSGSIRYLLSRRDQRPRSQEKPPEAQQGGQDAPVAATDAQPAKPPKEDLYRATFSGEVKVAQAGRMVGGDALDIWARLLDGALPPDAFPQRQRDREPTAKTAATETPAAETAVARAATPADDAAPAKEVADASDQDVVLTWSGSLIVRPIEAAPAELENGNHLALRFTADTTGHVAFADADAGIEGRCVWIDYRISSQDLVLAGPGPTAVRVNTRGGQQMVVPRLDLNLANGVGLIRGAGVMHEGERRLNWTDQCDLVFATEGGMMTGLLQEASFRGGVTAVDKQSDLRGDSFRAAFVPAPGAAGSNTDDPSRRVTLARLVVEGRASGASKEGTLRADRLDIAFEPAAADDDPEPRIVTAVGNVRAQNDDSELTGDFVEATLARDDKGDVIVANMRAEGNVNLSSEARRVSGSADRLIYDGIARTARLTASDGREALVRSAGAAVLSSLIDLDIAQSRLAVPGPGTFTYDPDPRRRGGTLASGPFGDTSIRATWTGSLAADDRAGVIECIGDVVATTDPSAAQVYLARAPYLKLELSPAESVDHPEGSAATDEPSQRRLLRAELASGDENNPALVESRTYAAAPATDGGPRKLEQFMRLTGGRIIVDDTAGDGGVLSVPGPGRAAIYDGRSGAKPTSPDAKATPADALAGGDFRGSALFTWAGSMSMDRPTGLLNLRRTVQLVHRPLGDEPPTTLECERLLAKLLFAQKAGGGGASRPQSAELVRAEALDAVYVESATRKLLADAVLYDAARRLVEATAAEGNRVTLYDEQRATAQSAGKLTWDLASDRIVIDRPSPVVAPYTQRR